MAKRKNRTHNQKEIHMADEQFQVPVTEAAQNLRSAMAPELTPAAPKLLEPTEASAVKAPRHEEGDLGLPPETIADPESVFRLGMLDERLARIKLERTLRANLLDAKILQFQEEKKNMIKHLGREESETTSELERVRVIISQKHQIDLSLYAYDDATGTLKFMAVMP
jgi:hypothetical protein